MKVIKNNYFECRYYIFGNRVVIDKLEVYEEFRNQGIGTNFMKWFIKEMDKDIFLSLTSTKPIDFYKRLGFEMSGDSTMVYRKEGHNG